MTLGNGTENCFGILGSDDDQLDEAQEVADRERREQERDQLEILLELHDIVRLIEACCPNAPKPDLADGSFEEVQRRYDLWLAYHETPGGALMKTLTEAKRLSTQVVIRMDKETKRAVFADLQKKRMQEIAEAKGTKYGDDGAPLAS